MLLSSNNNLLFSCFEALIMADMTSCGNALYKIVSASYPDPLFRWKCERKGRREEDNERRLPSVPFPWSLAVHHQSLAFRASLCHAKNEEPEEGIWNYNVLKHLAYSFAVLTSYIYRDMKNAGISKSAQEKTQFRRSPIFWKSAQIRMASAARDFDVESGAVCVKK